MRERERERETNRRNLFSSGALLFAFFFGEVCDFEVSALTPPDSSPSQVDGSLRFFAVVEEPMVDKLISLSVIVVCLSIPLTRL